MRRFYVGLAIVALGCALSACDLRAEISVNDDGSGTMGMTFAVEPEFVAMMQQSGIDPFAEMRSDLNDDPVPWKIEDFREGNLRGVHATIPFSSIADLERKIEELSRDSGSPSAGIEEDFNLTRDAGGGWRFVGKSTDVQEETGEDLPISPEQLAALLKLQFSVTLPGTAGETNATETTASGGRTTFTWKLSTNDRAVDFVANTTAGGGGFPVLPVGLGAAVVGVAIVIAILRGRTGTPPAAGDVPPADGDAFASPPQADQVST